MKKILIVSDSINLQTGVGKQSKFLLEGLSKLNKYKLYQLGANSTESYNITEEGISVYSTKGFAKFKEVYDFILEKNIDLLIIFSDPRFFDTIFENNKEIRKICPIVYWHVWDNNPAPDFNKYIYESVDVINCHSYLTYEACLELGYKEKTNFTPHTIPENIFYKLENKEIEEYKEEILGLENKNKFVFIWVNKNIKRKRAADLLFSWSKFCKKINSNAMLIMHTNPFETSGYNIKEIIRYLNLSSTTKLSIDNISEEVLNILYNISNASLNISHAEGFGLNVLEGMMTGTPPVALVTGGIKRQIIDFNDNTPNGVPIYPDVSVINGNQSVPFIYEDFASHENISSCMKKIYDMSKKDYEALSKKCFRYARNHFNYEKEIKTWSSIIDKAIEKHKKYRKYEVDFI